MVDILLAAYNGEKFISEQLDSLLEQSYQEFRILIHDDNSNDRTVDIVKEYEAKYPDKVRLISDDVKCGSSVSNFMYLTKCADSDYVMYCDQDDYWLPDKINVTLSKMQEVEKKVGKEKPVLIFADYKPVNSELIEITYDNSENQIFSYNLDFNRLLVQNYVTGCLMMVNKALYSIMGEYHKDILMHDWWAALIASAMGKIYHIPEIVMLYRQHGDNVVGVVNVKSLEYRLRKFLDPSTKNMKYLYENQAKIFLSRYEKELNSEILKNLHDFLSISEQSCKWKRIAMLKKGNFLKSDKIRQLGQFWYI